MWRYRELMPLLPGDEPVTLGEGSRRSFTRRASARASGSTTCIIKDESLNPTNSFKARGQSAAITRAKALGAQTIALPTAGNAGNAAAAYCRRRGTRVSGVHPARMRSSRSSTSAVSTARRSRSSTGSSPMPAAWPPRRGKPLGWYDVSTLKEPYRVEGKKTMGYELAEQLELAPARLDHLSDGRRHRSRRDVEGVRRARGDRLDRRPAAPADGVRAGRRLRADRARLRAGHAESASPGKTRTPPPTACACRARSATF